MIKLDIEDGYYDASELINKKGYATLGEILQDICNKKGVECGSASFLNSDKQVAVYDNQITAREYLSYIAESAGGFACIGRDGKLYIKCLYEDEETIPLRLFKTYKFSEEFKVSKVSYEDGIRSFKFGDDTNNTLWINQENMFVVDEDQVEKIYNQVKELTINSFEGTVVINPALDVGDKIIVDGKPIVYQGEITLNGRFVSDIKSKIDIKQKQETTVKKESQKIINRHVQSEINQIEGTIKQLAQETTENTEKITEVEQTANGITEIVSESEKNTVAEIVKLLNNGYLNAEQVNALVNGNAEDIATVKQQLTQTVTSSQMQIEITKAIEGGVSYLKNTLFTINENGMLIATNQDEFNAKYNNKGMYLYSYEQMIAKFDVNGATLKNLKVEGEIETNNLRIMDVTVNGSRHTHIHWIGG